MDLLNAQTMIVKKRLVYFASMVLNAKLASKQSTQRFNSLESA